jgi:nitroreductase
MDEIFNRRSIRKYADKEVEPEKIEILLRAAMQAPSAGNQRPWEFLVLENKESLSEFSTMCQFSKALSNSAVAVLLMANTDRMVHPENWQQDMGAAAQSLLIEAVHLGLGAVWLGIAPLDERVHFVKKLFSLKDNLKPYCVISIGYPVEGKGNRFIDRFEPERIHFEKY